MTFTSNETQTPRRPWYETDADLQHERDIADELSRVWRCDMRKLSPSYRLDFGATRGDDVLAWVEIKDRNCRSTDYSEAVLNLDKWLAGENLSDKTGLPWLLVQRYKDGIYFADNATMAVYKRIAYGGRTHCTRDDCDIGPVVMIDLKAFRPLHLEIGDD